MKPNPPLQRSKRKKPPPYASKNYTPRLFDLTDPISYSRWTLPQFICEANQAIAIFSPQQKDGCLTLFTDKLKSLKTRKRNYKESFQATESKQPQLFRDRWKKKEKYWKRKRGQIHQRQVSYQLLQNP